MASVGNPLVTIVIESYKPKVDQDSKSWKSASYGVHVETQHLPVPEDICKRVRPMDFDSLRDVSYRVEKLARIFIMEFEGVPIHIERINF